MALIPLIPVPLLDGKLVAHIYSDTPAWLLHVFGKVYQSVQEMPRARANALLAAVVVQMWSGELADQMSPWSRPTRTSDAENIDLDAKSGIIADLPMRVLESLVSAFHEASHLDAEKKSESPMPSESIAPEDSENQE